jgi:hypothetical protein
MNIPKTLNKMTTDTPRTDAVPSNQSMLTAQSDPVELYQQLCVTTFGFERALDACAEYRIQLTASQAEVERLRAFIKSILPPPPYGELEPEWKYAEKLLAETATLPEEAEAELSMWRDGGIMHEDHSKEIDETNQKLDTAIEIAKDALWYARIYENEIHFNKMDGLYQKLVALKNK